MKIFVNPYFYIYITVLLFFVPLPWMVAWAISVIIHEFGHFLAVNICGQKVHTLKFGIAGAEMGCDDLSFMQKIFCILSGPFFGLIPVLFQRFIPRISFCCWLLTIYNLLPIYPLDGGKVLYIILNKNLYKILQIIFCCIMMGISIYAAVFMGLGILPVAITLGLWRKSRNIPCKQH